MNDQVTAMMERARARASELAGAANVPATTSASVPSVPARGYSLDDLAGGFNCDVFLKAQPHGLTIGNDLTIFDEIVVTIDLSEVLVSEAIKAGDPARYWKTYDGIKSASGGYSWEEAVQKARSLDPKAYPYTSADIPMRPVIDLKSKAGAVLADPTKVIGYSLATTGKALFASFLKDAERGGMKDGVVLVRVTATSVQKSGRKPYGLPKFEYLGPAGDGELEDAA